ncbi:AAEL003397-PA [Aedes aegypti]|uniref:Large ribosomal subunit protein bL17m n=2 Tax=Aedes aegypti TaxID=7159 RepID=Q17FI8_AEDAE|nr:39S ribosomal protein L17, mitochondrial [Aedes aegypti]XP_021712794.1 39S ribosomal protein L17, mitochondrial-like [Aedes aegypti]EAT45356.1 AAEL003397-PA [Aedes aegypti]
MNQAEVAKLMSQLKIAVRPRHRNLKNIDGPEGRLNKLRKTVTALVKHERIELNYQRADEARGYAERLISDAIRYGDRHQPTMEMADFWLTEKQLVHKLFKVLAPRFEEYKVSATRMYKAPKEYPGWYRKRAVLELRGNPYPALVQNLHQNRNLLHNVLLDEARKDFRKEKYAEIAAQIGAEPAKETSESEEKK